MGMALESHSPWLLLEKSLLVRETRTVAKIDEMGIKLAAGQVQICTSA